MSTNVLTYTWVHAYTNEYVHAYIHAYTHMYKSCGVYVYMSLCQQICLHTHEYRHVRMSTCMHTYMHIQTCTNLVVIFVCVISYKKCLLASTRVYVCTRECMYVRTYTYGMDFMYVLCGVHMYDSSHPRACMIHGVHARACYKHTCVRCIHTYTFISDWSFSPQNSNNRARQNELTIHDDVLAAHNDKNNSNNLTTQDKILNTYDNLTIYDGMCIHDIDTSEFQYSETTLVLTTTMRVSIRMIFEIS